MSILQLLAQGNFITYNKQIAKKYGVDSAILLGAMCSYQASFENKEFYKEQYKIAEDTALSEYEIKKALKVLKENNIVSVKRKGVPSQNYYFVNADKLGNILLTSELKINRLESENLTDYNTNNTITNNTSNNKIKKNKEIDIFEGFDFDKSVKDSILLWLQFKKEKGQTYKETGLKTLLNKLQQDVTTYGSQYVVDEISNSIAQNYSGIFAKSKYNPIKETKQEVKLNFHEL